jgi:hypothetical protein
MFGARRDRNVRFQFVNRGSMEDRRSNRSADVRDA